MEFCSFSHYHFISFHFRRLCFCLFSSFLNWKLLTILIDHAHIFSTNKLARTHANPQQQTDDPIESSGKSVVQKKMAQRTVCRICYCLCDTVGGKTRNERKRKRQRMQITSKFQNDCFAFAILRFRLRLLLFFLLFIFYFIFFLAAIITHANFAKINVRWIKFYLFLIDNFLCARMCALAGAGWICRSSKVNEYKCCKIQ